jgi:hypothetical protein
VPGAGKTLVGLNVATRHGSRDDAAHAVFLSGNGPRKPGSYERIYDYLTGIGVAEV